MIINQEIQLYNEAYLKYDYYRFLYIIFQTSLNSGAKLLKINERCRLYLHIIPTGIIC